VVHLRFLVDHRERALTEVLSDVCEDTAFTQLPIGDYLFVHDPDAVVVERKTVPDFLASVRSNRLWDQLLRLMTTEHILGFQDKRRMLVVHGNFRDYLLRADAGNPAAMAKHWSQLMGAFLEIVYVYNTPIIHAEDDTALRAFLRILGKRESAGKNDKCPDARWYRKPVRRDLPVRDRKKYILCALPHIGNQLSNNLLSRFKTIANVACASVDELQQVPKIGKKKAELIYTMLH
jgi:ERCC4-type nuclease